MEINIIQITSKSLYFNDLINLELLLWPDNEFQDLYNETKDSKDFYFGVLINEKLIGFIQISIRYEYVNGSSTSPVGFLEGIFVLEEYRRKGIASRLVEFAFNFLKEKGCSEIASDALIDNIISHKFHENIGFQETERIVYFIKKL